MRTEGIPSGIFWRAGRARGAVMSDWIHNLPVPLMALAIFAFTYLLAIIIFAGVSALATGERAKSFQAISPGMLPVLGIIFGLFVAFTAAQVWSDNDRASAAVSREASALRAVTLLAAGLPPEQEGRLRDLIRGYVEQTAKGGMADDGAPAGVIEGGARRQCSRTKEQPQIDENKANPCGM